MFFFSLSNLANAQEVIYPYGSSLPNDPSLKELQWNRYTTKDNIVIMSIDDSQGAWMTQNIEKIRTWTMTRWGFPDVKFSKECRIFCVPRKELLKKLFALEEPKYELRKEVNVAWIVLEESPQKSIPRFFTSICLSEFETKNNVKLPWWFYRASSILNASVPEIKAKSLAMNDRLKQDEPVFTSQKVLTMTEQEYLNENSVNQKIFDQQAMLLGIMLRKEFGEVKLQGFLRLTNNNEAQKVLKTIYGFRDFEHFDKQYFRFMRDLSSDVSNNKTPDNYLYIQASK